MRVTQKRDPRDRKMRSARVPRAQVELLVANLPTVSEALAAGSVVVFEKARIRIRSVPITGGVAG